MAFLTMRLARSASSTPMADLLSHLKARHVRKWHFFPVPSRLPERPFTGVNLPSRDRLRTGEFWRLSTI